jgi:hypothetical protein
VTAAVAIYAAIVATAALGWQVFTWWRHHRTKVEVFVRAGEAQVDGTAERPAILVIVRNLSAYDIRIVTVVLAQDGRALVAVPPMLPQGRPDEPPGLVPPRDIRTAALEREEAVKAGLDASRPAAAWVGLASGETFSSKPTWV